MSRLTDKDCWKYEDFVFSYRNRETMQSGTYDHKELVVYDKYTRNEINTIIYEITEVEVG